MDNRTPNATDPHPWLGVLGVVVVVGFACLAVFDTSLHTPPPAQAATSAHPEDAGKIVDKVPGAIDQPIPLYASEAGAHSPTQTAPASPPGAPGAEATSLFDSH